MSVDRSVSLLVGWSVSRSVDRSRLVVQTLYLEQLYSCTDVL